MTHVIKTEAGNRILSAVLSDELPDIGDIEDLEVDLEEARALACRLEEELAWHTHSGPNRPVPR